MSKFKRNQKKIKKWSREFPTRVVAFF